MQHNDHAKHIIDTLFEKISSTGKVNFPFMILEAQQWLWAYLYLVQEVMQLVGMYQQDVLLLRDLSAESADIDGIGKQHTLKVSVDTKHQYVSSDHHGNVANLWAREISSRLSLAPAGALKIVLIENIDRMNTASANALLKSFEEPLPGRIIIWTTKNAGSLLDTIVSRAFVIKTVSPNLDQILTDNTWQNIQKSLLYSWVALSWWDQKTLDDILLDGQTLTTFAELETIILDQGAWYRIVQLIKELNATWTHDQLLDALILRASMDSKYDKVWPLITAKKMISSNVWSDNVWYGLGV